MLRVIFFCLALLLAAGCGKPDLRCSAENCQGCCDGYGNCLGGITFVECGGGGGLCHSCTSGEQCSGGTCVPATGPCGPMTCGGCCDAAGNCQLGRADATCGKNAAACQDCADAGYSCDLGTCIP